MAGGASFFALAFYALRTLDTAARSKKGGSLSTTLPMARSWIRFEVSNRNSEQSRVDLTGIFIFSGQLFLTAASMVVTWSSARSLQLKQGLPLVNQVSGWGILSTPSSVQA
jgi:hypothetical protein